MQLTIYHALLFIIIWIMAAVILERRKVLEKYNMSLFGPAIMWRTQKGKESIDRIAKPKRLCLP